MLHNVDVGWERSEPIKLVYKQIPISNVLAVTNSHEVFLQRRRGRNRFRLTKTIYMKLKHYYIRNNAIIISY
jgi:hypothetical protein